MSTSPGRQAVVWDEAGSAAVARFTVHSIRDEQLIQRIFEQLNRLADEYGRHKLVLDFGGVEAFASLTIGKLVALNTRLRQLGGRLALCNLTPAVAEVIDIMRLGRVFAIYPTQQDALQSF
jgi:anti-sigma B factor antagonist